MKFIVGLDLSERSQGALRFASWMRRHAVEKDPHRFEGLHVLEHVDGSLAVKFSIHSALEMTKFAENTVHEALREAGVLEDFDATAVVRGDAADDVLAMRCGDGKADALIVGRAAPADALVGPRLGRVARRLLRSLPVPVVVVPPTLQARDVPGGPVLVATDLQPHSVTAVHFGERLAETLGRPLRLVHVAPEFRDLGPRYVPAPFDPGVKAAYEEAVAQRATAWRVESDLPELAIEVEFGNAAERVIATAERLGSPVIVSGSRRLSLTERIFQVSTGSRLAAIAPCPVAVVPSL